MPVRAHAFLPPVQAVLYLLGGKRHGIRVADTVPYRSGTPWERDSLKDLVLKTAREPRHASLFNYASAAHNNHFFFEGLASEQTTMPSRLEEDLQRSFGSVQTLKEELTLTARGMFGPGFVWLVRAERVGDPESFRVLATYLAGSPYPGAHWRRQPYDMNTVDNRAPLPAGDAVIAAMRPPPGDPVEYLERRHQGSWGRVPDAAKFAPGGIDLVPVLCVNMWEHVWVHDYGVFREGVDGKANYLENWWNRINWNIVAERASGRARTSTLKTTSVSSR